MKDYKEFIHENEEWLKKLFEKIKSKNWYGSMTVSVTASKINHIVWRETDKVK